MKAVCPFCKRDFYRSARALTADRFCRRCLKERVQHVGGTHVGRLAGFLLTAPGYGLPRVIEAKP